MTAKTTVLIAGAGQIGSRHLQGLSNCKIPLRIFVQNPHSQSLALARERWEEVETKDSVHQVSYHESIQEIPEFIDVVIVATSSNIRAKIVNDISGCIKVKFWVLEKVLAQSKSELDVIKNAVDSNKSQAWVNTPRRMMSWHKDIKNRFKSNTPLTLKVNGDSWGLACNSIHFIDLLAWWTDEKLESVSTDKLDKKWFKSKRDGYWEVSGTLVAKFENGSVAELTINKKESNTSILVNEDDFTWDISEPKGVAKRSDGIHVDGRYLYQSELSAIFIESIIEKGICDLPSLADSIQHHDIFLQSMQEHWVKSGNPDATSVPIT